MTSTKPQYVPTGEEIEDAIAVALKDIKEPPTAKEVTKTLETENPTWKLPERRVGKYMRRVLKKQGKTTPESHPEPHDDEESITSTASRARELARSTSKRIKGGFVTISSKGMGLLRRKKQEKQAAKEIPPMVISAPKPAEEPKIEETPKEVVVEETAEKAAYTDDNTGSTNDQLCANCVIL